MAVLRVEVHEVREDEGRPASPQVLERQIDAVVVRIRVARLRDALAGEDVLDLPDAEDRDARILEPVEHRRARWRDGEVPPFRAPDERARFSLERSGDHAAHPVRAGEEPSRDPRPLVEHGQARRPTCASRSGRPSLRTCRRWAARCACAPRRARRRSPSPTRAGSRARRDRSPPRTRAMISGGNPSGYNGNGSSRRIPIISQWPGRGVLARRPLRRPPVAGPGADVASMPVIVVSIPRPSASRLGARSPPTASAVFASVSEPSSPYAAASGASPTPHESQTTTRTRGTDARRRSAPSSRGHAAPRARMRLLVDLTQVPAP